MLLFNIFSFCSLIASLNVLIAAHPIHSVLYLVLGFFSVSGLLFLIESDVLAILFVVVYIGAIAILFLFVIIILDLKSSVFSRNRIIPILPSTLFLLFRFLATLLNREFIDVVNHCLVIRKHESWLFYLDNNNPLGSFGQLLYSFYFMELLFVGLILLVALIGAVVLTLPISSWTKSQLVFQQVARRELSSTFQLKN